MLRGTPAPIYHRVEHLAGKLTPKFERPSTCDPEHLLDIKVTGGQTDWRGVGGGQSSCKMGIPLSLGADTTQSSPGAKAESQRPLRVQDQEKPT